MATADDTNDREGVRAQVSSPPKPFLMPHHIRNLLRSLLTALQGVQSTTIVASAALKYQAADFDEDIALTLQRNASDRLDVAIRCVEYLLYPDRFDPGGEGRRVYERRPFTGGKAG